MSLDLAHLGTALAGLKPHEQDLETMLRSMEAMRGDVQKLQTLVEQTKHLADTLKLVDEHMKKLTTHETHLHQMLATLRQIGA